ncbi:kek1 [Anopheles darlingi]|uniref:Kek1 n=1 Tax=Anopheles darlingi TaxID=43151 RepID=W5JE78_ANODA|nr:kek1 [Anopheles darlingi]
MLVHARMLYGIAIAIVVTSLRPSKQPKRTRSIQENREIDKLSENALVTMERVTGRGSGATTPSRREWVSSEQWDVTNNANYCYENELRNAELPRNNNGVLDDPVLEGAGQSVTLSPPHARMKLSGRPEQQQQHTQSVTDRPVSLTSASASMHQCTTSTTKRTTTTTTTTATTTATAVLSVAALWLGLLLCLGAIVPPVDGCPAEVCVCKWKGGKQTVECGGRALNRLPDGMDPGTQVLNFSSNGLTILQSERFKRMDLINLQKIYLARNQLVKIHDRAFRGLTNLVELDLSDNMLSEVPSETFADYSALMRLSLSGNPIRALRTSGFKHLSYLTTLELSNCQVELVEDEAFIGMDNLEWLRLDGNRITTIRGAHVLPASLHGINLQSNRWHCDCQLTDIHTWLNRFNVPQREEIKCTSPPRLAGETVKSLPLDDLACLPIITPETSYREIAEGRNISLDCRISATPEPSIAWLFQGQVLLNESLLVPNLHLYYYIDDVDGEKHSELFIYNINVEDNGTYSCVAENSAGRVQTNYTLHVIVKEEPVVEQVTFSEEYFLVIVGASAAIGFLLFLILCVIVCRCARTGRRRTALNGKKGVPGRGSKSGPDGQCGTGGGILGGGVGGATNQKCASITNHADLHGGHEPLTAAKMNGMLGGLGGPGGPGGGGGIGGDGMGVGGPQDIVLYLNTNPNQLDKSSAAAVLSNMTAMAQFCSPPSARSYQDQNPDLINDAESGQNKTRPRPPDTLESDLGEKDSDEQSSVQDGGSEASYVQGPYYPPPSVGLGPRGPRFIASGMATLPRGGQQQHQHQQQHQQQQHQQQQQH